MTVLDRRIQLVSVMNMRDLGGLPVSGGTLAPGQVYRSASLAELSDEDGIAFSERQITTVYDFRMASERDEAPDRVPSTIASISLDVFADNTAAAAAQVGGVLANPALLAQSGVGSDGAKFLEAAYRDIVALSSAQKSYREFFQGLADGSREGAVLFHCTTGKDRTGWAAAALLGLLGASDEVIRADYLQTNTDLLPALQPKIDQATAAGVDPELLRDFLGVKESYLNAAYDEVNQRFGTIENYFTVGLGLTPAEIEALRERLIV